jgi:hypothetical protein
MDIGEKQNEKPQITDRIPAETQRPYLAAAMAERRALAHVAYTKI